MERLTKPNTVYCKNICDGAEVCDGNHDPFDLQCAYAKIYDRLAAYEDLEEQGRLVVLPCKVGDTVYVPNNWLNLVVQFAIVEIQLFVDETVIIDDSDNEYRVSDFGKTVFLTRAEAEAALKGVSEDA